jgi:hypothetical protein
MRRPHVRLDHHQTRLVGLTVAVAASAVLAGSAAAAPPQRVLLPPATTPLGDGRPPLASGAAPLETRFRGPISSGERISVDVGPRGTPVAVRVLQRLVVRGMGDFVMGVHAPLTSVRPAPGSQSEPGRRTGLVLWQGFSPGGKVLAAEIGLDRAAAAPVLPLRVSLRTTGNAVVLTLVNQTAVTAQSFTAKAVPLDAARALDALRRAGSHGRTPLNAYVGLLGTPRTTQRRIVVPFAVRGVLRAGTATKRFALVLRRRANIAIVGSGRPAFSLLARPLAPNPRPPGARTWVGAVRAGRIRDGRALLELAADSYLRAARLHQYQRFLANPDPTGTPTATYAYRSVAARPAAASQSTERGGFPFAAVLAVAVLVVGLGAGVVLWAHS